MDTTLALLSILVGFNLAITFGIAGAMSYVLYRYVYQPWKVVRRDQQGLNALVQEQNAKLAAAVELVKMRSAEFLSDEELAYRESRLKARSNQRAQR